MENLISRLDLDHISNRPIVRWIVFFIALGALAKVDIDSGRMVLDENSIYPFLILTIVPASLGLKLGWQAFSVVRRCCIPLGVIVCMVNAVAMLANMDSQQEFLQAQRLIYAPLAFGILLSLLLRLVEPEIAVEYKLSFVEVSGLSLMLIVALPLAISSTTYEGFGFSTFWHGSAIAICMVVGLVCLVYPDFKDHTILEKIYRASIAIVLVFASYGVSLYLYGINSKSFVVMGSGIAFSLLGMMYGSVVALFAISAGGQVFQTSEQKMFFDWHMIELYAFFVLIVMPPFSLLELTNMISD